MFGKLKPFEYLGRSLPGQPFALDDLVSRHAGDSKYEDVFRRVLALSERPANARIPDWIEQPSDRAEVGGTRLQIEAEGR
jgi:hypothetical protein